MMRNTYRLIGIVVALVLVGCQAQAAPRTTTTSAATQNAPQTVMIGRGDLTAVINAAGTVTAQAQVSLPFQMAGRVKELSVKVGDRVKAGQVLAKLEAPDQEISLAKAQMALETSKIKLAQTKAGPKASEIAAARDSLAVAQASYQAALNKYELNDAQLAVTRAQVDKARATLTRAQAAYEWAKNDWLNRMPELSSQKKAVDDAQSALDLALLSYNQQAAGINDSSLQSAASQVAQAQYQLDKLLNTPTAEDIVQAEASVKQDEASLRQAQSSLAKASLVAPFDGTVGDVYVQAGQWVGTNAQAIAIVDLTRLEVAITLAEVDVAKIQEGQEAEVTLDAEQGQTFTGQVKSVDLVGTLTQGVVNYAATVSINNPTDAVRPGMNASASIILQRRQDVLVVPNRVLRTSGRARTATVLYQGQLIDVPVTLGLSGDTQSEVLSGLQEGDMVVVGQTTTTARGVPGVGGPMMMFR